MKFLLTFLLITVAITFGSCCSTCNSNNDNSIAVGGCTCAPMFFDTTFSIHGGTASFTVNNCNTGCPPWSVASDSAWVRITSSSTGTGISQVTYAVDSNPGAARMAKITGNSWVTVHQAGH